ncbi:SecC motif-containing protein [Aestuariicella hydrocarbonica]|uniref:SecC motif-containing protein n=1 Tax=Pseudomaricurvus hydrocarbonicus TaxID=1470433 RepID=A0A9E5MP63_9GAMM|nr:SEC-C metal-binding domain-containing protein [Aestuariicella hydrocarbonica]NHO67914.1 SecC motif-containing protein [Aestuariicella hydrocarbonica]
MKVGRNDPCPCGSGKKYKRCCMDAISQQRAEIFDDIAQTVAMNPNLSIDELNLVVQHKAAERNNRPNIDFCGLTPTRMANWMYAPLSELDRVTIAAPDDLATSPVMRYLALILEEAMKQAGSFKATAKGNLPAKLVKQASALLPALAVAQFEKDPGISEFAGSNEDKFNALHYTRVLAELAGIIEFKGGHFYVTKAAQEQYHTDGIRAFFLPMLEAAVKRYNWGYLDGWSQDIDLRSFWLFMLWRLQSHGSLDKLFEEVRVAFPDLLRQFPTDEYFSPQEQLGMLIESRFVERFLQYWGFVTVDPRRYVEGVRVQREASIQPLLTQAFSFEG